MSNFIDFGEIMPELVATTTETVKGKALDATVGKELKDAITGMSEKVQDSGWLNLTLQNGFQLYNSDSFALYRKIGNMIFVDGVIKPRANAGINNATGLTFSTLPAGYRPVKNIYTLCQGTGKNTWLLTVGEDGAMNAVRYGNTGYADSVTGSEWLPFSAAFACA